MERTRTAEASGQDFTTWDLPRILAEIDKHFTAALANERQLKVTAIADYNDLLAKGTVPDAYRPTLFDFLAHEALQRFAEANPQHELSAQARFLWAQVLAGENEPGEARRILVTESLPLPIRGAQTKKFDFSRLRESGKSKTLRNENLTVQMVSQPAWYAVLALPYLMEYPYECSEQIFNRLYANELARMVANADPKIRRIFDLWKNTPALDSPLEKNQELKSVMLEETPWVRQANRESEARRNVGILFDAGRLDHEARQTFGKLAQMQLSDGLWPWFPGFRGDEYITLYIATGFGRLRHLGVANLDLGPALKAVGALDRWIDRQYREILRQGHPEADHLNSVVAFYLYGRSFFLKDRPIPKASAEAVDYFLGQGRKHWLALKCRQSQGHLAIALKRFGDQETPGAIMKSIKEFSCPSRQGMSPI